MGNSYSSARTLRVVHLDHTTVRGGAELALVRLLAAEQSASEHAWIPAVLVPAIDEDDVFAELPSSVIRRTRGVRQSAGGSGSSPLRLAALAARLLYQAVLTRTHPNVRTADVVIANSTRAAAYAALALQLSRTPLVVQLRDMIDEESLGALGYRLMTKVVLPRADAVIGNSRTTLAGALPFLRPGVAAVVIHSASGLTLSLGRTRQARPAGPLRIGMLARIDPWKGQLELLEAFAAAFPTGTAQLELAGGAPFEQAGFAERLSERAAELGMADRVRLLGHVDDTAALLARWDIAVQYSTRAEPMGQNVLQYLAAGAVTVVAAEGGPVEWVDDGVNGRTVPPRRVDELTRVLRELADDPAQCERLSAAAAQTPGLLDDAAVAAAHAEVFHDVRRVRPGRRA
ncbi:glycosyltransferase family 4 protein [Microbacterium murale]|uniref:Glycosyltransferase involved in cell wall biosynthesis n=1 Tax=Microbacterium murale TaxID=1081040 RepID=A0ABU0PB99_9MICO|nr:glycosyltransferase family 4 protein [Microbacterium murale]MDQ0644610.1 glycosyltransferase involved in cell wall biosynthesis [Microbacterium murale]